MVFQSFKIKKTLQDVIVKILNSLPTSKWGKKNEERLFLQKIYLFQHRFWNIHMIILIFLLYWRIQIEIADSKIFHICSKSL